MDGDDFGRVVYLVILLAVVAGYFLVQHRNRLGQVAQQAAVWGLIFVGMAAGYGLWSDIRTQASRQAVFTEAGRIEVPRAPDGHFYLALQVNGTSVDFMIDTGASEVVLSQQDAERVGIDTRTLDYVGEASTANGIVRTARVRLADVRLGNTEQGSMTAWVNDGEMDISLLGMSYLDGFAKMEFAGNLLVLSR